MIPDARSFDFRSHTRLVVGPGGIARLGDLARALGGTRVLVTSDPGIISAGHTAAGLAALEAAGIVTCVFSGFAENPSTVHIDAGLAMARDFRPDLLVGLGGGSSMDCAKGINFLLSCGGRMQDYRGRHTATGPMLPSIAVPTTAGTGSETQSFALISDAETGMKMACGDPRAAFRVAILDVDLTLTQPAGVTALTGIDAVSHAVESHVSLAATPASRIFSREAWRLLAGYLPAVFRNGGDAAARSAVQLGAAWAGLAIENSMLGAAHALANPLTAVHHIVHGQAVGVMLPHVVRYNGPACGGYYAELLDDLDIHVAPSAAADRLAVWLADLVAASGLRTSLAALGVPDVATSDGPGTAVPDLAALATTQWTGGFNPRPVSVTDFATLYRAAR